MLVTLAACTARPPPQHPAAWPESAWHARFADADSIRVATAASGVRHVYLWLAAGPWAVHVVEIDEAVCNAEIVAAKAGPPLEALELTSTLGEGSIAALNADFFQAPGGTPVGAQVSGGRVQAGPGARPVFGITDEGAQWAGTAVLDARATAGADVVAITQVNRPVAGARHQPPTPGLTLFDEWYGKITPPDSGSTTIRVRRLSVAHAADVSGAASAGVVVARNEAGTRTVLDDEHVAFQGVGDDALGWLARRSTGDTVRWHTAVVKQGAGVEHAAHEAVGGFPLLVAGGRGVHAEQPGVIASFGPVRHPRTAVGWNAAEARTVWVVVDGRRAPYSDGMSLAELEWLMLRVGAADAVNLDGGGSTTLTVGGRLVNRPTDEAGERAVSNALVLRRCR